MARKQNPNDFLKHIQGRPVLVKLNSGVEYKGKSSKHTVMKCPSPVTASELTCLQVCSLAWTDT
jgi:hypothetical protein